MCFDLRVEVRPIKIYKNEVSFFSGFQGPIQFFHSQRLGSLNAGDAGFIQERGRLG
jgi:hypothetical protein